MAAITKPVRNNRSRSPKPDDAAPKPACQPAAQPETAPDTPAQAPAEPSPADALQESMPAPSNGGRIYRNPTDGPVMVTRAASEFETQPIRWLEPGLIPRGKLTLLAGDPGLGKSFLTLDLAARLSVGKLPEEPSVPARSLILSAEDDPADTIRPRLETMGADLSRVSILEGVLRPEGNACRLARLDEDMQILANTVGRIRNLGLIVIDPISAYLGATDSHNNADVRSVLADLARLAAWTGAAVVCVTHLNKDQNNQKKAIYRAMGSLAFTAAARTVFSVSKHPDDPEKRVVSMVKNNIGQHAPSRVYRIDRGRVRWLDESCSLDADTIEGGSESVDQVTAVEEAERFLRELLKKGPVPASMGIFEASTLGLSERTVARARRRLGVVAVRQNTNPKSPWMWTRSENK